MSAARMLAPVRGACAVGRSTMCAERLRIAGVEDNPFEQAAEEGARERLRKPAVPSRPYWLRIDAPADSPRMRVAICAALFGSFCTARRAPSSPSSVSSRPRLITGNRGRRGMFWVVLFVDVGMLEAIYGGDGIGLRGAGEAPAPDG